MADSSLFVFDSHQTIIYLLVYVDDIIITGNSSSQVSHLVTALSKDFELKDLGALSYFLGIQILPSRFGLTLCQSKYASDVLHRFQMENSKPIKTLCCPNHPTTSHLEAAKRVLHYVKGTLHFGLHLAPGPLTFLTFLTFFDADWTGDPTNKKSTIGILVFLGSNPVSWSSKKQSTISCSSTEAEYRALASIVANLAWLCTLFKELKLFLPHIPILWCDNNSTIALASNPVFHSHTKHIEVDYHYMSPFKRSAVKGGSSKGKELLVDVDDLSLRSKRTRFSTEVYDPNLFRSYAAFQTYTTYF
nr:uncharacterized protein LOC112037207 [Quercus suber]